MLGDYMQHQEEQHRSQSDLYFLKVQYAFWDLELDYRWRGKDGEASVGREGCFKLLIYINKKHLLNIPFILI